MNESETRAEYIDPKLKASGWGGSVKSACEQGALFHDGKIAREQLLF